MATKRLFQLLAAREEQPGVLTPSFVDAANATLLVSDPQITYERETFDRQINRISLTPLTPIEGVVEATCTFRVEVAGTSATAPAAPDWGLLLEACGFRQRAFDTVTTVPASWTTGQVAAYSGEIITNAGETAELVHDLWEGATAMQVVDKSGAFSVGAASGGTSGAQWSFGGVSNNDNDGYAWTTVSRNLVELLTPTLSTGFITNGDILIGATSGAVLQAARDYHGSGTAEFYLLDPGDFLALNEDLTNTSGSVVLTTTSSGAVMTQLELPAISLGVVEDGVIRTLTGCRGSVTFTANIGEPMFMDFEFRGLIAAITDGQLATTPTTTALVPPSFLEIGLGYAADSPPVAPADEHTACINSWSCEVRNEVAIERCAASTDGTRGSAFLSGRSVTGSIDPSVRPESSFPFLDHFRQGTTFRQRITLGSAAGNQFHFSMPATQITSEGGGDRNGLATRDLQYQASGKADNGADLEDRELTITYHQANTHAR